jgi:CRP-like cAMP-binding protein
MYQHQSDHWRPSRDMTAEDFDLICKAPIFSGLPTDAINNLLVDAYPQTYRRNEILFLRGEPAENFFMVLDGWVKLIRQTEDGHESIIGVFAKGETFAEAAMFDQKGYPVSAMAVENSRLLVIPSGTFMQEFRSNPEYAVNVVASMSRHMRSLVRQVEQLSVTSSTERLARFIVQLCPTSTGSVEVRLPVEKSLVAGRLGMQPETLSRALAKLRKVGVETKGGLLRISDVAALRKYQGRS